MNPHRWRLLTTIAGCLVMGVLLCAATSFACVYSEAADCSREYTHFQPQRGPVPPWIPKEWTFSSGGVENIMRGFGFKIDCMVLGLSDPKTSGYTQTGISINKYGWPVYCVEESHVNMFGGGLSGWREQGRFIAEYPKLAGIRTGVPWPKWIPNPNGKRRSVIPIAPLWLGLAVNIIFYTTLTYGGLFGARATQRWLRGRRRLCRQCGYPRPPGGLCPECGQQH